MGKLQRTKGAAGERELAKILSDMFGCDVKRKLGQARDSGIDMDLGAIAIECKRRKSFKTFYDWMRQALRATETMRMPSTPAVMFRADDEEWVVAVRLMDLPAFAREIHTQLEIKRLTQ